MKETKQVSILAVPLGKKPEVRLIHPDLKSYQQVVGGQICVREIAPRPSVYANDDGLRIGLPYNRCGFVGDFLISKMSSVGNAISMTDKDIATANEWMTRNDCRPPLCHVCGRPGGVTLFCPCRDVLIYCVSCYDRLGQVLNGEDRKVQERFCLCPRCRELQRGEQEKGGDS